jgi:hypothetical protein
VRQSSSAGRGSKGRHGAARLAAAELGACRHAREREGERASEREKIGKREREGRQGGLIPWRSFGGGTHPCGRSMASTVTRTSVPGWRKKIR